MRLDAENKKCFECEKANPQWASVPLGILICLECAGKHRGLGVHLSFVRSITMDTWSPKQIACMKVGGNNACLNFFTKHGIMDMEIKKRYDTRVAQAYREKIETEAEGSHWIEPSPEELQKPMQRSPKYLSRSEFGGPNINNNNNNNNNLREDWGSGQKAYRRKSTERPPARDDFQGGQGNSQGGRRETVGRDDYDGRDDRYLGVDNGRRDDYQGGSNNNYNNSNVDYSKYGGKRSISSNEFFGRDEPGAGAPEGEWMNSLYDGISKLSVVATNATQNIATQVTERVKNIDIESTKSVIVEQGNKGWALAVDYFNKAKNLVGEGVNTINNNITNNANPTNINNIGNGGYGSSNNFSGFDSNITGFSGWEEEHGEGEWEELDQGDAARSRSQHQQQQQRQQQQQNNSNNLQQQRQQQLQQPLQHNNEDNWDQWDTELNASGRHEARRPPPPQKVWDQKIWDENW